MPAKRVNIISLGCSKNLVDAERLMQMLGQAGCEVAFESDSPSDVTIVNTCGFIGDAKEESVNTILELCQAKAEGRIGEIIVMGCLSERYRNTLTDEIPEIDRIYGKFDWPEIASYLARQSDRLPKTPANATTAPGRHVTTGPSNAFIKIAEGCNRFCAFCAIPLITGRFKSRSIDDIVNEVTTLVADGYTEFNIIAQDLSSYGLDIYGSLSLARLIDRLADIEGVHWLRLHYAYPAEFPHDILEVMRRRTNVCAYLDIALQHASDKVLGNMRRHISRRETEELLDKIRREVPGIHIRTTLMVGFPGEGEKEFDELLDFVKKQRFERMGAFAYCEEEDTFGARNFTDDIPDDVKQQRLDRLMKVQEEISLEIQQQKVGTVVEVVIDSEEDDYYIGRTQWDSPEVDPQVLVEKTDTLIPGKYYNVRITEALPFELVGHIC